MTFSCSVRTSPFQCEYHSFNDLKSIPCSSKIRLSSKSLSPSSEKVNVLRCRTVLVMVERQDWEGNQEGGLSRDWITPLFTENLNIHKRNVSTK